MKLKISIFYITGIFFICIFTIIGGIVSIVRLSQWTNHFIRSAVEGDFPLQTSHHEHQKTFDSAGEAEIDKTVRSMTIIIEINMGTTALNILTSLMLFTVVTSSLDVKMKRINSILSYIIWNIVSIIYNSATLTYIFLDLTTYRKVFFDITLGMIVNISLQFCFVVFTILYYRHLQNTYTLQQASSARIPLNGNISIDEITSNDEDFIEDMTARDTMLIEMVPRLDI